MKHTFSDLPLKCAQCGFNLIRLTDAKGEDWALCTECGGFHYAKEVVEYGAGLIREPISPKEILDLREQVRLARAGR
jgi:hypothetical protein